MKRPSLLLLFIACAFFSFSLQVLEVNENTPTTVVGEDNLTNPETEEAKQALAIENCKCLLV